MTILSWLTGLFVIAVLFIIFGWVGVTIWLSGALAFIVLMYYSKSIRNFFIGLIGAFFTAVLLIGTLIYAYFVRIKRLRKLAERGNGRAQSTLGARYKNGTGIEKDYLEGFKWLNKAAEQGYADAQFNLGEMYRDGLGVKQSDEEAIKWFRKSAEQKFFNAIFALDEMGVEKE